MPRGQRKSLEEKIQAKQELINALNIRIESEERELEELYEQKRRKELEAVSDLIGCRPGTGGSHRSIATIH